MNKIRDRTMCALIQSTIWHVVVLGLFVGLGHLVPTRADEPIVFLEGHSQAITAVDWSDDSGTLVTGGLDATVRLWDVKRRTSQTIIRDHGEAVSGLVVSPDGSFVASGSLDGTVLISDIPRLTPTDRWPIEQAATTMAVSVDGAALAVGYESGAVSLHDAVTGQSSATFSVSGGPVKRLIFEPDAAALVVAATAGRIERRSTSGDLLGTIDLDAAPVDVSLSTAGDSLAVARNNGFLNVHRWPPADDSAVALGAAAERVAMAASGDWFAVTGDAGNVCLLDIDASVPTRVVTSPAAVRSAVVTPDGASLVVGGADGVLRQCLRGEGDFVPLFDTLQGAVHDLAWCKLPDRRPGNGPNRIGGLAVECKANETILNSC